MIRTVSADFSRAYTYYGCNPSCKRKVSSKYWYISRLGRKVVRQWGMAEFSRREPVKKVYKRVVSKIFNSVGEAVSFVNTIVRSKRAEGYKPVSRMHWKPSRWLIIRRT